MKPRTGLIQVYTGDGKGKTTAALGLALRAAGHGLSSYVGQFLKGQAYGELAGAARLKPSLTIEQYGLPDRIEDGEPGPQDRGAAHEGLTRATRVLQSRRYDIVILDEICVALSFGLVSESETLDRADLVSEIVEVRHPFSRGIEARLGIEF